MAGYSPLPLTRLHQNYTDMKKGLPEKQRKPLLLLVGPHRFELWTKGL